MADKRMNEFPEVADAEYVYAENNGIQGKIAKRTLMEKGGVYKHYGELRAGESITLPYCSGLIMVQINSMYHEKALALLFSSGNGAIIIPQNDVFFFSEVDGKCCVLNTGGNTQYLIKNKMDKYIIVSIIFIG